MTPLRNLWLTFSVTSYGHEFSESILESMYLFSHLGPPWVTIRKSNPEFIIVIYMGKFRDVELIFHNFFKIGSKC